MKYYGNQNVTGRQYADKHSWYSDSPRIDLFKERVRLEDAFKEALNEFRQLDGQGTQEAVLQK